MQINLHNFIKDVPNFPKLGILFKDISPLLASPEALHASIDAIAVDWKDKADVIVGLDARGFIFGSLLASKLKLPFVMIRKKGKLPGESVSIKYDLEYGSAEIEIQKDAIIAGSKILVVDDLLATGGTAAAACKLVEKVGGQVSGCAFVIELSELGGRNALKDVPVKSLLSY